MSRGNVEYFAILTVVLPGVNQAAYSTITRVLTAGPNATRASIYEAMREQLPSHVKAGNTMFFSAEPNRRGGS
jgi:hypothetical protein